jgi:hypothetical protein
MDQSMRPLLKVSFFIIGTIALGGCASTTQENTNTTATDESCYVTGSIVPRKDCRGVVNTASGDDLERARRAPPPVAPPAPGGTPR